MKCKYAKLIDKLSLYSLYQILTKYKVIWSEDLSIGSRSYGVHCARLQIDQDGPGHVFPTGGFIVVDVDSLELEIGVTIVATGRINAVFIGNHFPELKKLNTICDKYSLKFVHKKIIAWLHIPQFFRKQGLLAIPQQSMYAQDTTLEWFSQKSKQSKTIYGQQQLLQETYRATNSNRKSNTRHPHFCN